MKYKFLLSSTSPRRRVNRGRGYIKNKYFFKKRAFEVKKKYFFFFKRAFH